MNSVDLFYQIFKMRYSMGEIQNAFASRYCLGLLGEPEDIASMRGWMGAFSLSSGVHPEKNVLEFAIPQNEEEGFALRNCDALVCHLGVEERSLEQLIELSGYLPAGVPVLYICEPGGFESNVRFDINYAVANMPIVHNLLPEHEEVQFAKLLFTSFPRLGMRLARDYTNLRQVCVNSLIRKTCNSMAILAAASSVSVNVPLFGQALSLLAAPAETLAITAAQLRMVLYIGALYGRPLDFFDRVNELWMVIGGGWGWRTIARELVGFIPGAGFIAKAGVAWSGTYVVGEMSRRLYEKGEKPSPALRREVTQQAKSLVKEAVQGALSGGQSDKDSEIAAMLGDVPVAGLEAKSTIVLEKERVAEAEVVEIVPPVEVASAEGKAQLVGATVQNDNAAVQNDDVAGAECVAVAGETPATESEAQNAVVLEPGCVAEPESSNTEALIETTPEENGSDLSQKASGTGDAKVSDKTEDNPLVVDVAMASSQVEGDN